MTVPVATDTRPFPLLPAVLLPLVAVVLLCLGTSVVAPASAAGPGSSASSASGGGAATQVKFLRNATSSFDAFISGSNSAVWNWMHKHYWRMRGYPPFFNQALDEAPDTHFYLDLYAIYNAHRGDGMADLDLLEEHPDWVLRDANGNRLFIPYDCDGSKCTQFAADIGNPEWRSWWIDLARSQMDAGYEGIHIDDVNLEFRVGDASGSFVPPIDPRTGGPMTLADWQRYMAEFVEEAREALPGAEISHNPIWWAPHGNKFVQRQIDAADIIELERGFNDGGLVAGRGKFGLLTFMRHIDWLHSRGKSVVLEPYGLNRKEAEYELAGYFLTRGRSDAIIGDYRSDPGRWWRGWETDLGKPRGKRKHRGKVVIRRFRKGVAILNQPGTRRTTVKLPRGKYRSISGKRYTRRAKLNPGRGLVLVRRGR